MLLYCSVLPFRPATECGSASTSGIGAAVIVANTDHNLPIRSAKHYLRPSGLDRTRRGHRKTYIFDKRYTKYADFRYNASHFRVWGSLPTDKASNMAVSQCYRRSVWIPKNVLPFESCWPFSFTYQPIVPSQAHARKSQRAFKHT